MSGSVSVQQHSKIWAGLLPTSKKIREKGYFWQGPKGKNGTRNNVGTLSYGSAIKFCCPDNVTAPSVTHSASFDPYGFENLSSSLGVVYFSSISKSFMTNLTLDEPLNPQFWSLDSIYSEPFLFDPDDVDLSHCTSFANMISTAETYREPPTYKHVVTFSQVFYWQETWSRSITP